MSEKLCWSCKTNPRTRGLLCDGCFTAVSATQEDKKRERKLAAGGIVPMTEVECPHCHTTGQVVMQQVKIKSGISGGKATAAVLTGGLSVIGTGLSRKGRVNRLSCGNCRMTWQVA